MRKNFTFFSLFLKVFLCEFCALCGDVVFAVESSKQKMNDFENKTVGSKIVEENLFDFDIILEATKNTSSNGFCSYCFNEGILGKARVCVAPKR